MNEVTLQLPKTLYQNLKVLAEREAVSLAQYIVYILTSQMPKGYYTVRVVSEDDIVNQKASFDNLLKKWGRISPSEAEKILDGREPAEPEKDLSSDIIDSLKARIARNKACHCDEIHSNFGQQSM